MIGLLTNLGTVNEETWITVGIVVGIFTALAVVIVTLILVVGKVFKVDVDEKVTKILNNLAGANCGGCGCSSCASYASDLARGKCDLSECQVTSHEGKAEIAKILGVELKDEERTVAVVKCDGGSLNALDEFKYAGNPTCASCATLNGGNKVCKYACLGCSDCKSVCPVNAIKVENGLAEINPDVCISCGACIRKCPKGIIKRIPASAPVYVACSSELKGKDVTSACKVGCIACGLCAKKCPHGAITMENNLPSFDYSKCTGCKVCVEVCPRNIILER